MAHLSLLGRQFLNLLLYLALVPVAVMLAVPVSFVQVVHMVSVHHGLVATVGAVHVGAVIFVCLVCHRWSVPSPEGLGPSTPG